MSLRDQTHLTTRFKISISTYAKHVHCSRHTDGDVCFDSHARRSFRTMWPLKNCLHSKMTTEGISVIALMQVQKETELDFECIIQFSKSQVLSPIIIVKVCCEASLINK